MTRFQTALFIGFSATFAAIAQQQPGTVTVPIHLPPHEQPRSVEPLTRDEAALAATPEEQKEGQLDASQTLFTVFAAINAAGFDTGANSPSAFPLRAAVRKRLAALDTPSISALRAFYRMHTQKNPVENVSQYISLALSINGPPDFDYRLAPNKRAPDVADLAGLPEILPAFYREAHLAELWKEAQPAFDQAIELYHSPISRAVLEANAYLRNATGGLLGRRFQVYIDLLGVPGQTQSRSYQYDTWVVVTPAIADTPERTKALIAQQVLEVRHAYLHYLLDPLSIRYSAKLDEKQELLEMARPAPALDQRYKTDFWLLTTESLIRAVEARLATGGEAKRQEALNDATREGFVLAPAFYDGLVKYEAQEQSMRVYYPDLVGGINVKAERKRLATVDFVTERSKQPLEITAARQVETNPAEKLLMEAEDLSSKRQLEPARQAYLKVLDQPPAPELHARAYYGLARIAVLQNHPDTALDLFQRSLGQAPDGETRSWACYYLGRLFDAQGDTEQAVRYYRSALDANGASPKAQEQARKALAEETSGKTANQ